MVHVGGGCRDDLFGYLQALGVNVAKRSKLDAGCRDGPTHQLEATVAGSDDTHAHTVVRAKDGGGNSEGTREAGGYFANENTAGLHRGISFILPFTGNKLPKDQHAALAAWMAEREQTEWEAEIERDFAPGGPGLTLIDEMKAEARAGKFRPLSGSGQRSGNLSERVSGYYHRTDSGNCTANSRSKCSAWLPSWIGSHEAYDRILQRMK
jgi:hypothetical protein